MYYIERNPISDATFLAGGIAEPSGLETEWVSGQNFAVGDERTRTVKHRVYRCATAITGGTVAPELDSTRWQDMRPTDRYLPLGPQIRTDGKLVYQNYPLVRTSGDIVYVMAQRYANAVAMFGLKGAGWKIEIAPAPGEAVVHTRTGVLMAPATGYWNYAYGQRLVKDRVLVTDLPIYPNAEITITIMGTGTQTRAISQLEVGKLRFIPGVELQGTGTGFGVNRIPKAFTNTKVEENGGTAVLIYGTSYDMRGTVELRGNQEDGALIQLRNLIGKGAAYTPTLCEGFEQSLVFGVLKSADVVRQSFDTTIADIQIDGLPT